MLNIYENQAQWHNKTKRLCMNKKYSLCVYISFLPPERTEWWLTHQMVPLHIPGLFLQGGHKLETVEND